MERDTTINVNRAKNYASAIRSSLNIPVDLGDQIEMKLPDFAEPDRIKSAQKFFRSNFYSLMFSMYIGLLSILAIPSILDVLIHTAKSSSDLTAYKRYMRTIYHTLSWFRHDLKPGTKAWQSLEAVRKFHFSASRSAKNAKVGMISQRDMAITQYGFMGFTVLSQKQTGAHCNRKEIEDFCHFWRVIGHIIGIHDEFNLCAETYEETIERLEAVRTEFLLPNLQNPPKDFERMTRYIANGLWCFNPFDPYNEIIFMAKRLAGVPDYFYFDSEMPENYDRRNLKLYTYSYCDRIFIFLSVMTRQFFIKCFVFRWFFNLVTYVHEFFIRYFPILAFFKFGFRDAYVKVTP